METILMIDGENFKKKISRIIKNSINKKVVWGNFDFKKLIEEKTGTSPKQTKFYGARIKEYKESLDTSQRLIQEQRALKNHLAKQGVTMILTGQVRRQKDSVGPGNYLFKEKGVDVKIAVDLICAACDKTAAHVILASSDSDLQPAVREARKRGLKITYLGFQNSPNRGLMHTCSNVVLIKDQEILSAYQTTPSVNPISN